MNRLKFGQLVQELRREHGVFKTQDALAERIKQPATTIQHLETGAKSKITSELINAIADTLELTILERQQFMLAAMTIDLDESKTSLHDDKETQRLLVNVLEDMRLPGFITDKFADVIAANTMMIKFLKLDEQLIDNARNNNRAGKINLMRVVFDKQSGFRKLLGSHWQETADHNIQFFRGVTLRHRADPYFQQVLSALMPYSSFAEYWKQRGKVDDTKDTSAKNIIYEYLYEEVGEESNKKSYYVRYYASISTSITANNEFRMVLYIPLSEQTDKVFRELYKEHGNGVIELKK